MSLSFTSPPSMPSRVTLSIFIAPARLGSAASADRSGCTLIRASVTDLTSSMGNSSRPLRSKNRPPSGWRTLWKRSGRCCSAEASRLAPSSASSGVAPSTTIMVRFCSCGNALSNSIPRLRQSSLGEINWLVSAVMAKFWDR